MQSLGFNASLVDSLTRRDTSHLEHRKVIVRSVNFHVLNSVPLSCVNFVECFLPAVCYISLRLSVSFVEMTFACLHRAVKICS